MRRAGLCLALLTAVAIAACGSHMPTTPTPPVDGGNPPPPPPPPPPPTLSKTAFLAFGDSLTEGVFGTARPLTMALSVGLPTAYPFQLNALLSDRYTAQSIVVWNGGRAGERAADALPRLTTALDDAHPQVLLLLEGVNDLGNGATIQTATNAVEDLTRAAMAKGVQVIVATYPPERPGPSTQPGVPERGNNAALVLPFNDALKKMALKKGAMVVDIYPQFDVSLVGPDGLHPTAAGYTRMAQVFFEAIEAAWEQPATGTASRLHLGGDLVRRDAQETVPCRRRGPGQVCS